MGKSLYYILSFLAGAAIGGTLAYFITKEKWEARSQKDIEEYKEYVKSQGEKKAKTKESEEPKPQETEHDILVNKTQSIIDYTKYYASNTKKEDEVPVKMEDLKPNRKINIITPEMFANEKPYYDKVTLYYYGVDDMLVDEERDPVDISESIGLSSLSHFGEYEKDVVYVRNDRLECDYEVIQYADESFRDHLNEE